MRFGIAILRAVIGGLFVGHGLQKLTGAFGGHGIEGTAGFFENLGLHPPRFHARAAGIAETAGGAALVAGLATPAAAATLTGTMAVAVQKVHGPNGLWAQNNGFELHAIIVASLFAITAEGPGVLSLDRRTWGTKYAIAALAAGIGGGLAMIKFAESNAPAESAPAANAAAPERETAGAAA